VKSFTEKRLQQVFLEEYFREELARAEFGEMDYTSNSQGTKIVLKVGRVGYAIGKKGKTIKKLTENVKEMLGSSKVSLEVDTLKDAELNPWVMAAKLGSALQRGRHFRRTAYGTMRRIISKGSVGVEIVVAGKVTSQRARVEKFREGFIAKTGDAKRKYLKVGHAIAKIKRGTLGITVAIMDPETVLPDQMNIIAEPTHTSKEIKFHSEDDLFEDEELIGEIDESEVEVTEDTESFPDLVDIEEDAIPDEALELIDEEEELDLGDEIELDDKEDEEE